ncbi:MAG: chemotaxis protein CheA [Deferrisomatales bacterium]
MQPDRVTAENRELLPDYLADARECLDGVSGALLAAGAGEPFPELIPKLFRWMHIIKGGAGLMGFATLEAVAHGAEELVGEVKKGRRALDPQAAGALLAAHDALRALLDELEAAGETSTDPGEALEGLRAPPAPEAPASGVAAAEVPSEEADDVLREFFVESRELVEELEQDLVALEGSPDDKELLNKIFRAAHTVKGSSSFLGFQRISEVTHRVEDVFNKLRRGERNLSPGLMDVVLDAVDRVRRLLDAAERRQEGPRVDDLLAALTEALDGGRPRKIGEILVEDEGVAPEVIEAALRSKQPGVPLGEALVTAAGVPAEAVERSLAKQSQERAPAQAEQTVRVDVERLDALMNLVGELVLGKNRLARLRAQAEEQWDGHELVEQLADTSSQIDLVASDLQLAVMKTRLVPIDRVFRKFPRMVRDLARTLGKEIRLEIQGENTELDKSVVESIGDPLIHLIRNAADHGIELPAERERRGKAREGRIRLAAAHEGNHIIVTIEDDGKGMDPEILKRKAVEKGVLSAPEAAALAHQDALNLIFAPGFSTATEVTNVSGRGVGMDVVKTNIHQLNGMVELDSAPGRGTRVVVRIPLTLAIIQALLVRSGREVYAVPLASVVETVRIAPGDVKTVDRFPVLRLRDQVVPLLRLDELFRVERGRGAPAGREYVVVLGLAEKRVGLVVDGLVGEEEVVIKSLGSYLLETPGIAGATIRGDGRVTLIVDVNQVATLAARARPGRAAAA